MDLTAIRATEHPRADGHPGDRSSASHAASHLPALDGVRGVAIILVLCAHGARFLPGQGTAIGHAVVILLNLGWSGVQLFFVLSGFLITRLLLVKKQRSASRRLFREFYARRALRIFPLYYIALAVIVGVRWSSGLDIGPGPPGLWWYVAYLQNWYNAGGHIPQAVGHFWSLAIEEQFYIVWPFVVVALSRRTLARTCVAIVAGVVTVRLAAAYGLGASSIWLYHSTVTQLDGLAMGSLLACVTSDGGVEQQARRAGSAMLVGTAGVVALVGATGSTAIFGMNTPFSVGATFAFSLAFAGAMLSVLARPVSPLAQLLATPMLRSAGRISYGLYVVHYPVSWALARTGVPALAGAAGLLLYLALSIGLALLSWRFVEAPFLAIKDRLGRGSDDALATAVTHSARP
jgi:peptidoglycan/LPS O-acetylase OafA/YrhL